MTEQQSLMADFITADLMDYLVEDYGISMDDAMDRVYFSDAFSLLRDPETGLYLYGSAHIYEKYKKELAKGLTSIGSGQA